MNVGELKEKLEGYDDRTQVIVRTEDTEFEVLRLDEDVLEWTGENVSVGDPVVLVVV